MARVCSPRAGTGAITGSTPSIVTGGMSARIWADWRRDLAPAIARLELGMGEEFLDGVQARLGDVGVFQPCLDLGGGERREDIVDESDECGTVSAARLVRAEPLIVGHVRPLQHDFAEAQPLAIVLNREIDRRTITRDEWSGPEQWSRGSRRSALETGHRTSCSSLDSPSTRRARRTVTPRECIPGRSGIGGAARSGYR